MRRRLILAVAAAAVALAAVVVAVRYRAEVAWHDVLARVGHEQARIEASWLVPRPLLSLPEQTGDAWRHYARAIDLLVAAVPGLGSDRLPAAHPRTAAAVAAAAPALAELDRGSRCRIGARPVPWARLFEDLPFSGPGALQLGEVAAAACELHLAAGDDEAALDHLASALQLGRDLACAATTIEQLVGNAILQRVLDDRLLAAGTLERLTAPGRDRLVPMLDTLERSLSTPASLLRVHAIAVARMVEADPALVHHLDGGSTSPLALWRFGFSNRLALATLLERELEWATAWDRAMAAADPAITLTALDRRIAADAHPFARYGRNGMLEAGRGRLDRLAALRQARERLAALRRKD